MSLIKKVDPMTKARAELVMTDPFFGVLALRMRMRADPTCKTAWCDGVTIGYNPDYINSLRPEERKGLLVHELMHPALLHHVRRGNRHPRGWNIAADYALNPLISKHYALPKGALEDPKYAGMSADQIYNLLPKNDYPDGPDGPGGEDDNDPGNCGEVRDNPRVSGTNRDASDKQGEAEWKQALAQARHVAKMQGQMPAELDKLVDDVLEPMVDWKSVLRRFCSERARDDQSWSKPNRRFIGAGLYLPSLYSEKAGAIVIGRDTSGSIYSDPEALAQFMGEIASIVQDVRPSKVYVIDIDTAVHQVIELEPDDDLHVDLANAKGGGGTSFTPLWEWMEREDIEPKCVVYLTDGYGTFPTEDQVGDTPVMWAMTTDVEAPVGETIRIS